MNEAKTALLKTYEQSKDAKLRAKAAAEIALIAEHLYDHSTAVAYADTAIRLDPELIEARTARERLAQSAQQRQTDQVTKGLQNVAQQVSMLRTEVS